MNELVIKAGVIGSVAYEVLQAAPRGQVTGITTGGIFLYTEAGWVLFLSFANWCGPLTINLPQPAKIDIHLDLHTPFQVELNSIYFTAKKVTIELDHAQRWTSLPRPSEVLSPPERVQRYDQVLKAVIATRADRFEPGRDVISNQEAWLASDWVELPSARTALTSRQPDRIIPSLTGCLGHGPGLTPAGDDIVLGFLLALNRWGDRFCPDLLPDPINQALIQAARQFTTALSANLIECAARGLADERLVATLDGLVSGNIAEDRIVEHVRGWGHTSGAAALKGMGILIGSG